MPGSGCCSSMILLSCLRDHFVSCHMKWSKLGTLQVYRLGFAVSTPTVLLVLGQYDAASVCLQSQSWNLWILLQLHKHKSPSRKPTQLNNTRRDRKDEKADHMEYGMVTCPQQKICVYYCVATHQYSTRLQCRQLLHQHVLMSSSTVVGMIETTGSKSYEPTQTGPAV